MRNSSWPKKGELRFRRSDNTGKRYKHHREPGPRITPRNMMKAIRGSLGIIARIARKLHVLPVSVRLAIKRPGFEHCEEALQFEKEGIVDSAEKTVADMIEQREEFSTALRASKFLLERKGKHRGWRNEVTIQGGENPLKIENSNVIDIDSLDLSVEMKRALLENLEAQTKPKKVIKVKRVVG